MRKYALTLMASLLSCSGAYAFWPEATDSSLEIGVGYRQDKLEWKTSSHFDSYSGYDDYYFSDNGYECVPNALRSHLKWRNLNIWQIEARGKYVTCDNVYLRANADYGWITSGKNTDRDFSTELGYDSEFSRSHSKVRGNVYDVKIAVGYQFRLCDDSFSIAPLVGYSWNGQHLRDRHLRRDFNYNDNVSVENFSAARSYSSYYDSYDCSYGGNHSKYHTRWNGPFIGFDADWRFGCCCEWDLFGGYEFHFAEYHAKAKWDLRQDLFDGFRHRAKNAYGHVFDIGVRWDFCECWTLAVKGEFQWWWANHGRDRALIANRSIGDIKTDCYLSIPLKDIKWESAAISVDLGMVF